MTFEIGFHEPRDCRKLPTSSIGYFRIAPQAGASDISAMSASLKDRVQERLATLAINPSEVARRMTKAGDKTGRDFVYDLQSGKKVTVRADKLASLARALDCDPAYLTGEQDEIGAPPAAPPATVPLLGLVRANADGSFDMSSANESHARVPLVPGATTEAVALRVSGGSMHTKAPDGALIYFDHQEPVPPTYMIGEPCVVETEDGRVLYKWLQRGSAPGLYDLISDVGEPIRDVRLKWVAEVLAIVPPRHAQRIIARGDIEAA